MIEPMREHESDAGPGNLLACLLLGTLLLVPGARASSEVNPVEDAVRLVEETTERLFAEVQAEQPAADTDPARSAALVDDIVSPHVDYERVSRWVLGPHWVSATPEQRARFVEEFRALLVRSYANAIIEYGGAPIEYLPVQAGTDERTVTVPTRVPKAQGAPVRIDYRLHRAEGGWKLFDVVVGGTSLVVTHRISFSEQVRQGGLDALIRGLAERNGKLGQT